MLHLGHLHKCTAQHLSRLLLMPADSSTPGSNLDATERPRSITGLPQPSSSHCQGQQAPLQSARHIDESQLASVAKGSSMSSGSPSLQRRSKSGTADVLGAFPPLKHRHSNNFKTKPPGNSATSTAMLLGSAWLSENARAAAAVPSCGKSNQVRLCCTVMLCCIVMLCPPVASQIRYGCAALSRCAMLWSWKLMLCRAVSYQRSAVLHWHAGTPCSCADVVHNEPFNKLSCMVLRFGPCSTFIVAVSKLLRWQHL